MSAQPVEHLPASVVIASWRRPEDLARGLAAVAEQLGDGDEIVVVARHDDAETIALVEDVRSRVPAVRLEQVDRAGVVAAMDVGLRAARGDIVVFTDDDTVPRPGWLERIRAPFADPRVGGVGGRDWIHDAGGLNEEREQVVGTVLWFGRVVGNHHAGIGPPREVHILKGANMAFRRSALLAGGFDPRLRGGGSQPHWEVRTSLEVWRRGWRLVYDPAVELDHYMSQRQDDKRSAAAGRSSRDVADAAHNHLYGLLAGLRGWRRLTAAAFQLLVGSRDDPGVVLGLERAARGDGADALRRTVAATRGRVAAFATLSRLRAR